MVQWWHLVRSQYPLQQKTKKIMQGTACHEWPERTNFPFCKSTCLSVSVAPILSFPLSHFNCTDYLVKDNTCWEHVCTKVRITTEYCWRLMQFSDVPLWKKTEYWNRCVISYKKRAAGLFLNAFTDEAVTTSAGRSFHICTTLWRKVNLRRSSLDRSFRSFSGCPRR